MNLYDAIQKSGGRRFVLCLGAGIINTGLLLLGNIDQEVYKTIILATVAVYVAGNGAQKWTEAKAGK